MQVTAQQVLDAVSAHNYALAAILILIAAVYGVRKIAPLLHGKLGAAVNSQRGGALTLLAISFLGALSTAFAAKVHLSLQLVTSALIASVMASGGWNLYWDLFKPDIAKTLTDTAATAAATAAPPATPEVKP